MSGRVFHDNHSFFSEYENLQRGDVFVGRLTLQLAEEHLLLDLATRGIRLIPSATAQMASRSKVFQTHILAAFMPPLTTVINNRHQLLQAITLYNSTNPSATVVTKEDRGNGGIGIHIWQDVEQVFNHAGHGCLSYPFVLQPFVPKCRDIRVLLLGDYVEAYERVNPDNFRQNLFAGGTATPVELDQKHRELCGQVMARGDFPYAHVDLIVAEDETVFVGEINLRGGLHGAAISPDEYKTRIRHIHEQILRSA